jgi:hypothetical protein
MERICRICRKIDLIAAFQEEVEEYNGNLIADLGKSRKKLQQSGCAMCRFFGSVFETVKRDDGSFQFERCQLRAFSAKQKFMDFNSREMKGVTDPTLLGVLCGSPDWGSDSREHVLDTLKDTGYLHLTRANQQ